jgi:hypothetical protein
MIILQNCKQVDKKKEKKNVYMLCLVYAKTDEIQWNCRIALMSPFIFLIFI